MRYQVLGPLEAGSERTIVGLGGRKQRLVLALLLIDVGRTVAHDRLVDELWADEPPDGARHVIQTYVSELRRLVDDEIRWEGGGYRLAAPPDAVDARRFESLVESARDRMRDSPAGAGSLFREALALWRGEPYAGLEETPAVRLEAVRLRELRIGAIEDRLQADLDAGLHGPAAIELEALTREHPFRERLRSLQMVALYRAGRQADALAAYRQTREMLVEELGIDPSPELQSLEQRILAQDAALLPPALAGSIGTASAGEPSVVKATPYDVVRGFELRDHVGAGRTTTVYRGYQSSVGREVAIKVVHPQIADSAAFVQAFEPRAQAIARIDHRHVVPLLDFWRDDRGSFLVMPWMRSSLHEALRHGPWSLTATLRLLEQVGSALGAASEAGLNHGAVSTTNILLDGKGDALLTDFPIIPLRLETAAAGPSSDVRALAAVALEALTGRTDGTGREAGLRSFRPDIPAAVDALVRATLPGARAAPPGGVQDLLRGLRRAAGADVIAPPGGHVTASIRNPYKGLRAFQESDALDFFGRQVLAERLLDSVRERRFVALIGPSGSGKSSLVRAALIPAIRAGAIPGSQEWLVTEMFPAAHPFEELGSALLRVATRAREHILAELLADPGGMAHVARRSLPEGAQLILVVDQLEELFSLTTDAHVRSQFLDGLTQLATYADSPVRVVVTLRADFLDGPLQHRSFAELLRAGLVLITPPSAHDLSLAVARPAGQVGVDFESGLVERVVSDVAEQPGALPLLQHALTELFDRRDGRRLTTASYEAAGGVRGALGRRAEEVYASLPTPAREAARQVFLRLVSVDEQREDARRRVRRTELRSIDLQPGLIDVVLQEFGAHRLLSFDRDPVSRGPTVEVAHEALFREWPRLGAWIGDRRHDLRLQRRLQVAAADWRDAGTIDDYLLGGGRLEEFERWTAATDLALTQDERAYLVASRARERRLAAVRRRRRRFLFGGVLAAAFVGLALVTVAFTQQNRAQAEERLQRTRELAAASRDLITSDPDLAVLLALEAVEVRRAANESPVPEAVEALHEALLAHRLIQTADVGGFALAFVGDGERLFSSAPPRNRPTLWNLDTGEPIWTLPEVPEPLTGVAVSAAAEVAAQTYIGGPTRVWDLQSGQMIAELASLGDGSFLPALTTDGRLLAIVNVVDDAPQSVSIHDILAGDEQIRFDLPGDPTSVAFSPDGSRLAIGDGVAPVTRLFDVATGDVITSLGDAGDDRIVTSVAFHPSGKELAMFVSRPSEIQVIAVESGELTRTLTVGADAGRLCISGDGRILAAAAADELLHVWDFESGVETLTLPGTAQTNGLSCAPDATRLGSTTSSGAARIWDLTAQGSAEVLSIGTSRPFAASWSPDGQALLTSHHDAPLRRYAAEDGRLLAEAAGGEVIPTQFAVSPDGRHLAANGPFLNADAPDATPGMRPLLLYDAVTFEPIVEFEHGGVPIDLSDDGSLFLAGDVGVARVFDVTTGRTVQELQAPSGGTPMPTGALLPDGRHAILVAATEPRAWIFELHGGVVVATICTPDPGKRVAHSRDGRWLAIASAASVHVWDLARILANASGREVDCDADRSRVEPPLRQASFIANGWQGLDFSPDGSMLATAGFDGVLGVWDVATAERLVRIDHAGVVGGAAFSPDGDHILVSFNHSGGSQHALRVYTTDLDELVAIARARLTRPLTAAECELYELTDRCDAGG